MNLSVDSQTDAARLMQRVNAEVARRSSGGFTSTGAITAGLAHADYDASAYLSQRPADANEPVAPGAIKLTLPIVDGSVGGPVLYQLPDGGCALHDLLCHQDRDFIYVAYLAALGRPPDTDGFETYLRLLRNGSPKVEILRFLHQSPEGRLAGRSIKGLALRLFVTKLARFPIIGSICHLFGALGGLEEAERQQRILSGYIFSELEQSRNAAQSSQELVNRALADLEAAYSKLAVFAATKPGYDALAQVASSAQSVGRSVNALNALVDQKANGGETHRALEEIRDSMQSLELGKADADELSRLKSKTEALRLSADSLHTDKADINVVTELRRHFVAQLETKADRKEAFQEILACREMTTRAVGVLQESKADRAHLNEAHQIYTAALATKAERHELTDLTNHLVTLIQSRLTREEVARVEKGLREAIHSLSEVKADRDAVEVVTRQLVGAVEAVRVDGCRSLEESLSPLKNSIEMLGDSKVDQATLCRALAESQANTDKALASLADEKVDRATLDARKAELNAALHLLSEEVRREVDGVQHRVNEAVTQSSLNSALTESKVAAETALDSLSQSVTSRLEAKADLATVDATREHFASMVDESRTETIRRMDAAVQRLMEKLDSLAKSRPDAKALDTMRTESKAALDGALARVSSQTRDLKRNLLDQERRLGLLLDEARKRLPHPIAVDQIETMLLEEDHLLDSMYARFEDIFRGTREDIRQRQAIYLPYIRSVNAGLSSSPVIDIGCGRGEWLEVLRDAGLHGRGIDINRVFLAGCREINLDVMESDGVVFLRSLAANSVGAVTSFHLVEHLDQKTLIALFDAAFHVLKPGGIAIFETPNPRNLQVGACNFYMDPTHRHPLPPELLRYLMEARGFGNIQIEELHPPHPDNRVTGGSPMVNETLNRFLFSAQDYAVIGKKA